MGLIMAHVDDFIILGDENSQPWLDVVNAFHAKYRWSPWEVMSYNHCGVAVRELPGEILMDQSSYCAQVEEIK